MRREVSRYLRMKHPLTDSVAANEHNKTSTKHNGVGLPKQRCAAHRPHTPPHYPPVTPHFTRSHPNSPLHPTIVVYNHITPIMTLHPRFIHPSLPLTPVRHLSTPPPPPRPPSPPPPPPPPPPSHLDPYQQPCPPANHDTPPPHPPPSLPPPLPFPP